MAITKPGATTYQHAYGAVRNIHGDASRNTLQIIIGLWFSDADRRANIEDGERMPPVRGQVVFNMQGYDLLKEPEEHVYRVIYDTALTLPAFQGWVSDEVPA